MKRSAVVFEVPTPLPRGRELRPQPQQEQPLYRQEGVDPSFDRLLLWLLAAGLFHFHPPHLDVEDRHAEQVQDQYQSPSADHNLLPLHVASSKEKEGVAEGGGPALILWRPNAALIPMLVLLLLILKTFVPCSAPYRQQQHIERRMRDVMTMRWEAQERVKRRAAEEEVGEEEWSNNSRKVEERLVLLRRLHRGLTLLKRRRRHPLLSWATASLTPAAVGIMYLAVETTMAAPNSMAV